MRFSSPSIISVAVLASVVCGFKDTSSFYSNKHLSDFQYITESSELSQVVRGFTEEVCNSDSSKVIFYRVNNLDTKRPEEDGTFIKHVHYGSNKMLDLELGSACDGGKVVYYNNFVPGDESPQIAIVDVEDGKKHYISEFLNSTNAHIIVQGKPSFHSPESRVNGIKHYIEDKIYDNLNVDVHANARIDKRGSPTEDDEFEKIQQEVEDDFKAAQSLIAEAGDSVVTIAGDDKDSSIKSGDDYVQNSSSLFTKYQFFTAGIWSCLIVSGFLLFILYQALTWVTSVEVSYKAFEKQVDYEKKNE